MVKTIVSFFDNGDGDSKELNDLFERVNRTKYEASYFPTSGPHAIQINDYELRGYNDVKRWLLKLAE